MSPCEICQPAAPSLPQPCKLAYGRPCGACTKLAELDSKIAETRATLEKQLATRHAILLKVNKRHDPMACRLPVEITMKIFLHCMPDVPPPVDIVGSNGKERLDASFVRMASKLVKVSKTWYNIGCATPELWSTIHIQHSPTKRWLTLQPADLKHQLQRSGDYPLTIRVSVDPRCDRRSPVFDLIEVICSQAHRWKVLCVKAPMSVFSRISEHTSKLAGGAPQLSCLVVTSSGSFPTEGWSFHIGSPTAPLLAPYHISISTGFRVTSRTFDLTRLSSLHLGVVSVPQFIRVLVNSTELSYLHCFIMSGDWEWEMSQAFNVLVDELKDIAHPNLKSLEIPMSDGHDHLEQITFRALESLYLRVTDGGCLVLHDFLVRSRCPLKTLKLDIECEEEELLNILRLTPNLTDLSVCPINFGLGFFIDYLGETANQPAEGTHFLPHLESFRFRAKPNPGEEVDWSQLNKMIANTKEVGCRPLRRLVVEVTQRVEDFILTLEGEMVLFKLIDGGLDIAVWLGPECPNILLSFERLKYPLARLHNRNR